MFLEILESLPHQWNKINVIFFVAEIFDFLKFYLIGFSYVAIRKNTNFKRFTLTKIRIEKAIKK